MKFINLVVVLGLFATPGLGMCQGVGSTGYMDADNQYQAIGLIKSTIYTAQIMQNECQSRFPELGNEFKANLNSWEKTEAEVLRKTNLYWETSERTHPKLHEARALIDTAVKYQFKMLENSRIAGFMEIEQEYCHNYFADLASGIWRKRTPRAYKYMDNAKIN